MREFWSRPVRNPEKYLNAVEMYSAIRKWCKKEKIRDYDAFMERLEADQPGDHWAEYVKESESAQAFFIMWFARMHQYDAVTEARKEGKAAHLGDASRKGKAVPCVCLETGEEFRSFAQAGKRFGVNGTLVSDVCYDVRDSLFGYHFRLKSEVDQYGVKQKDGSILMKDE